MQIDFSTWTKYRYYPLYIDETFHGYVKQVYAFVSHKNIEGGHAKVLKQDTNYLRQ